MDIKLGVEIVASTKPKYILPIRLAMIFIGRVAAMCYTKDYGKKIWSEAEDNSFRRAESIKRKLHHHPYDQCFYNLQLTGIPKILAMILNNEKFFATSEKSARYTQMEPTEKEKKLYDKWLGIFKQRILAVYPRKSEEEAIKLAQENARYLISVFTPTSMVYATSLRQINYILGWMNDYIADDDKSGPFAERLKLHMAEFVEKMRFFVIPGLDGKAKDTKLSLFDEKKYRQSQFGETYCTTYHGTYVQLADALRHRTLDYKFWAEEADLINPPHGYFVPPIIGGDKELSDEWLSDIKSVADLYPQGTRVQITERGTFENFILKTKERRCSKVSPEFCLQLEATYEIFTLNVKHTNRDLFLEISKFPSSARCGNGYKCVDPCEWGVDQIKRLV